MDVYQSLLIPALIVLVLILAFIFVVPRLAKNWIRRRIIEGAQNASIEADDPLLASLERGRPALVYFTAEWCGQCKTEQVPAIEQLQEELGDGIQVLTVDLDEQPEDAKRWGVMSAPRTFILTPRLRVHTTNLDVTLAPTLRQQVEAAVAAPPDFEGMQIGREPGLL